MTETITPIDEMIESLYQGENIGTISIYYHNILTMQILSLDNLRNSWQVELQVQISEESWGNIWKTVYKATLRVTEQGSFNSKYYIVFL